MTLAKSSAQINSHQEKGDRMAPTNEESCIVIRIPSIVSLALFLALGLVTAARADLLVSSRNTDQVLRYDGTTGAPVGSGVFVSAGSAGLDDPTFLTFTPEQAPAVVPEPAGCTLLGIGAAVLSGHYWRRRRRRA